MAKDKDNGDAATEAVRDMKPGKAKRALKAGVILAAAGLTALAVSRRMKSRKAKAAGKKKARKAGRSRKVASRAKSRTSGARRTSRAR